VTTSVLGSAEYYGTPTVKKSVLGLRTVNNLGTTRSYLMEKEMNKGRFKALVVVSLLLNVFGLVAGLLGESSLPEELASYLDAFYKEDLSLSDWIMSGVAAITLVANIGILFFASWSRLIFTIGLFLSCAGMFLYGPVVRTGLETSFYEVGMIVDGLIIGLMYFSEISEHFEKSA
jgi:hypothetical protein